MTKRIFPTLALAGAMLFAAACSDDSTGPVATARPVALLADPSIVDFDTTYSGSEASNLLYTLRWIGTPVTTIEHADSATVVTALRRKSALIIPENESGNLVSAATPATLDAIRQFVIGGGTLILPPDGAGMELLDTLFDVTLTDAGTTTDDLMLLDATVARGTPFAAAESRLFDADGTYYADISSLPTGAKVFYPNGEKTPVASWTQGRGRVVLVGWDWYDAYPNGRQDYGWVSVLKAALSY